MKFKTPVIEKIQSLLMSHKHLRDDDNKLIATIWHWQIQKKYKKHIDNMSAMELLKYYASRQLASAESIRRSRAKLQEMHESLRGQKYEQRHKTSEQVKKDLKDFGNDEA